MRVRCVARDALHLSPAYLDRRSSLTSETIFPLTVGREYAVYSIFIRSAGCWYLVIDDNDLTYPMPYPAALFEITNDKLGPDWRFRVTPDNVDHVAIVSFSEWAHDTHFYDKLVRRETNAMSAFEHARQLMSLSR